MIKRLLLLFVLTISSTYLLAQQTISGTFSPAEKYNFGILYMIDVNNVFYKLDSQIADGKFEVETKEDMPAGMYRLVYNLPQTENFFDFIYSGKENINFNFSDEEGLFFNTSEENTLWYTYKNSIDAFSNYLQTLYAEDPLPKKKIEELFVFQQKTLDTLEEEASQSLAFHFMKAYRPYIPSNFVTEEEYVEQYKNSYFDTTDFNNLLLQKSGLPLEMIIKYVFNFTDETDSKAKQTMREKNIDFVASKISSASTHFQKSLLDSFWQFLVNNEQTATANYVASEHLIPLATKDKDTALVDKLFLYKSLSIGAKAPNFSWEEDIDGKTKTKWLHDLDDAENYIIVFWSSLCSHCLKEVPQIHSALKNTEDGKYKVIAVGLEDEPYDWQNTIFELPDFTHVLGLGKWENNIGNMYDVSATPTYFVLDADQNITEKPESFEDLMAILGHTKG